MSKANKQVSDAIAGSNRVYTSRVARRIGSSRSFAARVRSLSSYHHNNIADSSNNTNMTHNSIYTTSITPKVGQGDSNAARNGDAIQLISLRVKGYISSDSNAGAFGYRILVGYHTKQFNVLASTSGLSATDIFLPSSGASWQPGAIINPKAFTCLYDSSVDINSAIASTVDLAQLDFKVPLSGKFEYISDGSVYGKTRNLYMIVIGGKHGGTAGVTSAGFFSLNTDLIFQDSP